MLATKPSTADSWYTYIKDKKTVNKYLGYSDGIYYADYEKLLSNLTSAKTTGDQVAIWQSFLRDIVNGTGVYAGKEDAVITQAKAKYGTAFAKWMKDAHIPTAIQDIYTDEPLAKLPDYMQGYLALIPNNAKSVADYTTTLNNQLGTVTDSTGNKLFTPAYINSIASGNSNLFDDLTGKVSTVANDAVTKQSGTSASNLSSAERASLIKDLLYNPTKINAVLQTGTQTGTSTPSGIAPLINPKLLDAQGNYRPYLSTWTAPKQGVASTNSPYSGLLDAMLNKVTGANYGTPETNKTYDALTSALTQGAGVNSLPKPKVTYNANNSAGITGLGIDYTGRTLAPLNTQVTSAPSYNPNQIANAKTAIENAQNIVNTEKGGISDTLAKKQAEEKAALEKAALEKAALEKAALEKAALEKAALEKAALEKAALEKAAAEKAAAEKAAADAQVQAQTAVTPNPTTAQSGNLGVLSLPANTVVQSPVNAISNQTVTPVSAPQPVYATTTNPTTAQSGNLGIINPATLGPVVSPQAMNSTAGGVASLVGPQVQAQPVQTAVTSTPVATSTNPTPAQSGNLGIINPATLSLILSPQVMNSTAGGVASLVAPQVQAQNPVVTSKPVQTQQTAPVWWQDMGYSSPQEAMDVGGFDASAFR